MGLPEAIPPEVRKNIDPDKTQLIIIKEDDDMDGKAGESMICGKHNNAIKENTKDIGELTGKVTILTDNVNKFVTSLGAWQERINGNFRIVNWVLGIFSLVGTALVIAFLSKLIWGN